MGHRGKFISILFRFLCLTYGGGSIAVAVLAFCRGSVVQLPASLDPSLVIRSSWIAIGVVAQAIVVCAFLTAVAESLEEENDSEEVIEPGESRTSTRFTQKTSPSRILGVSQS